jgi:parvulin-like peptidyl-prolyl isomerase
LLKRIDAGEDFGTLARKYSEDADARGGGDENDVSRDDMGPQLGPAVFAMKPGQVSRVLTADAGYYIFKVTDHKPARVVPFEEAATFIRQGLGFMNFERLPALIERLKTTAKIEVLF